MAGKDDDTTPADEVPDDVRTQRATDDAATVLREHGATAPEIDTDTLAGRIVASIRSHF